MVRQSSHYRRRVPSDLQFCERFPLCCICSPFLSTAGCTRIVRCILHNVLFDFGMLIPVRCFTCGKVGVSGMHLGFQPFYTVVRRLLETSTMHMPST